MIQQDHNNVSTYQVLQYQLLFRGILLFWGKRKTKRECLLLRTSISMINALLIWLSSPTAPAFVCICYIVMNINENGRFPIVLMTLSHTNLSRALTLTTLSSVPVSIIESFFLKISVRQIDSLALKGIQVGNEGTYIVQGCQIKPERVWTTFFNFKTI